MAMKNDAKFEEKLTLGFKIDMKNLVNFHPTTKQSKNVSSMGYFCPKYMRFELKKNTDEFENINSGRNFDCK